MSPLNSSGGRPGQGSPHEDVSSPLSSYMAQVNSPAALSSLADLGADLIVEACFRRAAREISEADASIDVADEVATKFAADIVRRIFERLSFGGDA